MFFHVGVSMIGSCESATADLTNMWFLTSVDFFMSFQLIWPLETFTAVNLGAKVWLLQV